MCPLVNELKQHDTIETVVCVTGQHKEMLDQVLGRNFFHVCSDYNLGIRRPIKPYYYDLYLGSNQSWSKRKT